MATSLQVSNPKTQIPKPKRPVIVLAHSLLRRGSDCGFWDLGILISFRSVCKPAASDTGMVIGLRGPGRTVWTREVGMAVVRASQEPGRRCRASATASIRKKLSQKALRAVIQPHDCLAFFYSVLNRRRLARGNVEAWIKRGWRLDMQSAGNRGHCPGLGHKDSAKMAQPKGPVTLWSPGLWQSR
jgi:hypothetical protein